ncbi:MAG TPA: hypothetical protein DD789_07625 [Firmicutes bacterium]|nr:hypothetical protein [Bacillota bacterium]
MMWAGRIRLPRRILPNVPNNQVCDVQKRYIKQKRGFYSLASFMACPIALKPNLVLFFDIIIPPYVILQFAPQKPNGYTGYIM